MSDQRQPEVEAGLGFETAPSQWGRRYGLRGKIAFELGPEGLFCVGQHAGYLLIEASKVQHLRSVVESSKYGSLYTTRIWVQGGPHPAVIQVAAANANEYIQTIAHFAHRVATLGGLERLERGSSAVGSLALVFMIFPVLLGGLFVSIFALANDPWYQRFAPTFVVFALFLVVAWAAKIAWPSPVRDWNEYLTVLQGLKGQRA